MNKVIDLETIVLLDTVRRGVITDRKRIEKSREAALDELEQIQFDAGPAGADLCVGAEVVNHILCNLVGLAPIQPRGPR
jgi:hypothetical protein